MIKFPKCLFRARFHLIVILLCWCYSVYSEIQQWLRIRELAKPFIGSSITGPLTTLVFSLILGYSGVWLIQKLVSQFFDTVVNLIKDFRQNMATEVLTGSGQPTRSLMRRLYDSKVGVAGVLYTLSQVRTTGVIIAQMTVLSSLLDVKEMVWNSIINNLTSKSQDVTLPESVQKATEHSMEEMLPAAAMFATVANFEIGDVKLDAFMGRLATNQRNADTIWKTIKPTLVTLGILKNSQYEAVIEIANTVAQLSEDESWLKFNLSHSPVTLLSGTSQQH